MDYKSFKISLSGVDRLRIEIFKRDHDINEFVVQYEALIKGEWREVVRYDNRGKPPHADIYDVKGRRYKEEIPDIKPKLLIPWCIEDLKGNWKRYKKRYLRWIK
ncbi:MAG: hypothetical protein V3R86_07165 [Candidatus Hydrothermarchaeaceae archaeon]